MDVENHAGSSDDWDKPRCLHNDRQFIAKKTDGCEVQGCGREEGGSEALWHARVLCGSRWEAWCEVLLEHGAGSLSSEHKDKQSPRRCPPILGAAAMSTVGILGICRRRKENPPPMHFKTWGQTQWMVGKPAYVKTFM